MDLLLSLSGDETRRTVILVTHDAEVAGRAECVIRMQDGRLLGGLASPVVAGTVATS
jgi:predicted ABC-type transport system involved in lysophospholipase L1 biosynthesis ATPase subunit